MVLLLSPKSPSLNEVHSDNNIYYHAQWMLRKKPILKYKRIHVEPEVNLKRY